MTVKTLVDKINKAARKRECLVHLVLLKFLGSVIILIKESYQLHVPR